MEEEEEEEPRVGLNPDWMSRLPEELHGLPLWNLAVPGSRDSMSLCLDGPAPVVVSEPRLLRVIDRLVPCWTRPCVPRRAATQTILPHQCDLGLRFFDLRISGTKTGRSKLFTGGGCRLTTVKEALRELATWLDSHPKEIVILSLWDSKSLSNEDQVGLVNFILRLFGDKLCSSQDTPTLRSTWIRRQQVVVSYDSPKMALRYPQLWLGIPDMYTNSPDPQRVITFLEAQMCRGRPAGFYVYHLNRSTRTTVARALSRGCGVGGVNVFSCDCADVSRFCSLVIGLNDRLLDAAWRKEKTLISINFEGKTRNYYF